MRIQLTGGALDGARVALSDDIDCLALVVIHRPDDATIRADIAASDRISRGDAAKLLGRLALRIATHRGD